MPTKKVALSSREHQIVNEITLGKTNREIATTLGLAEDTVATYLRRIRTKLGLTSKLQIALWAKSEIQV